MSQEFRSIWTQEKVNPEIIFTWSSEVECSEFLPPSLLLDIAHVSKLCFTYVWSLVNVILT